MSLCTLFEAAGLQLFDATNWSTLLIPLIMSYPFKYVCQVHLPLCFYDPAFLRFPGAAAAAGCSYPAAAPPAALRPDASSLVAGLDPAGDGGIPVSSVCLAAPAGVLSLYFVVADTDAERTNLQLSTQLSGFHMAS